MKPITEHHMRQTLVLAKQALAQGELPIAAIVVLDDQIISSAFALDKREQRFLIHAELLALEVADKQEVYRVTSSVTPDCWKLKLNNTKLMIHLMN